MVMVCLSGIIERKPPWARVARVLRYNASVRTRVVYCCSLIANLSGTRRRANTRLKLTAPVVCGKLSFVIIPAGRAA